MRVTDLRKEHEDGWIRAIATVHWERRRRDPQDIYFAVPEGAEEFLRTSANAFLVACVEAATYHFEPRIHVEGEMCPVLVDGVGRALRLQFEWFRDARPIPIEGPVAVEPFRTAPGSRPALAFSGGVDSLAILMANRKEFDLNHPRSFVYGVVVSSGFDPWEVTPGSWYWDYVEAFAAETSLKLVPIETNVRDLEPANHFFTSRLFGAELAAMGHAMSRRLSTLSIASAGLPEGAIVEGSHPKLDPLFSSGDLEMIHDSSIPDRYDRTVQIAEWSLARRNLKVCLVANRLPQGQQNCGVCEKCIRTRLTLLSVGKLEDFPALEGPAITPDWLDAHLVIGNKIPYYERIEHGLAGGGYAELAAVVRSRTRPAKARSRGLSKRLRNWEQRYLGGHLRRAKRRLFG